MLYPMLKNYIVLNYVCMINYVGICYVFDDQIKDWIQIIVTKDLGLLVLRFFILLMVFGYIVDCGGSFGQGGVVKAWKVLLLLDPFYYKSNS